MTGPLISVIVPVYKVEPYIHKCLDSILAQTYTSLEIILIDDGSPDSCGAICDEYADKDSRFVVVHKENGGAANARNLGIDIAKGIYIGFVDSDDWIEPSMYECLYNALVSSNADISICGLRNMPRDEVQAIPNVTEKSVKTLERIYLHRDINIAVWNRLYKKELLNGIRFPTGKAFEDIVMTYQLISAASVVSCIETPLYNYLNRDDSASHTKICLDIVDGIDQWQELQNLIPSTQQHLADACIYEMAHICLINIKHLYWQKPKGFNKEHAMVYNAIMQRVDLNYRSWIGSAHLSIRYKLVLTIAKLRLYRPFKKLENWQEG